MLDSEPIRAELVGELDTLRRRVAELETQAACHRDCGATEQPVRENDQLFRQLVDHSSEVLWFYSADRRELLYVSSAYERIWGRSVASLYANPHTYLDAIHPDDRDQVMRDLTAQQAGTFNDQYDQEYRVVQPDQSVRWVWTRYMPIRNESGDVYRIAGISTDVTDRKQVEIKLQRNETRLKAILDTTIDAIITTSTEGIITTFNSAAEEMYGYTVDEVVGKNVHMLVQEPDATNHDAYIQNYLVTGEAKIIGMRREVLSKRKDGSTFPVELSVNDMRKAGELGFTALIRDITDRKRAEERIRFTQYAVDHNTLATYWIRSDGRICYVNHAACEALGYSFDELVAMSVPHFDPDFSPETWPAHFQEIKAAGSMTFESHHQTKQGHVFPVEIHTSYLEYEGEEYTWAYVRDITERKRAGELLQERERELAHVTRLSTMGEIVAEIAHEINQPLYAIDNFAKACIETISNRNDDCDEELLEWICRIEKTAKTAGTILNRIGQFVSDEHPCLSTVNLSEVIAESIWLMDFEARRQQVIVRFEPTEAGIEVVVDHLQIQQVFVNLLKNAFEAMKESDEANRRVTVRTSASDGSAEVIVEDTGPGISVESAGKVFDAFYTTKSNGMGMGLAVSRRIIEDHGGNIWMVHGHERGAVFHFTLPLSTT